MNSKLPIVAIVGRANVGKSSLYNALLGRREAVVAREAGTTRDSIASRLPYSGGEYWLIDTAGFKIAEDEFELSIQEQITEATAAADVILVTIEAPAVISDEDRRVAKLAHKSKKPLILVVNKSDQIKKPKEKDYLGLGIKNVVFTSTTQKKGLEELLTAVEAEIPPGIPTKTDKSIKIALLGRPNVGKSSLFNSLAKKQQAVVSDRAGTTRDVNRIAMRFSGQEIILLDTAGIRRAGKVEMGVEHFSVLRSIASIEEADICMLVLDAEEIGTALDQKIAGMIKESGRGLVLLVNKYDLLEKDGYTHSDILRQLASTFDYVPWAPVVFTSAISGQNVTKLFEMAVQIYKTRESSFKTTELNKWLAGVLTSHPPAGLKNRQPKLRYIVHEEGNPIPSFKVFGSQTKFLHWSYKRYLERTFREKWPMDGTPIKFWFIEQHGDNPTEKKRRVPKRA